MNKRIRLVLSSLIIVLALCVSSATAGPVQPSGKKVGVDPQGRAIYQVHANGIDIGYKLVGSGEPLLMIMGLGGTMENWPREVVDTLSRRYQLILMDNRGMGHSTATDGPFTYPMLAGDVVGLLDALHVARTNVLGYSLGSSLTQKLLLDHPQRFDRAVIHATSTDGSNVARALHGRTPDDPTVARQVEATTHWRTPMDKVPAIPNRVLLIVGTADRVVGVESSRTLAAAIPGAWLVQFEGATHHLMAEAPTDFCRIVLAFLEMKPVTPKPVRTP